MSNKLELLNNIDSTIESLRKDNNKLHVGICNKLVSIRSKVLHGNMLNNKDLLFLDRVNIMLPYCKN